MKVRNGEADLAVIRSGNAAGTPVLFLHGITSSADGWQESAARLADRFDCWALDFRSHGDSGRSGRSPLLSDYAADAEAVLAQIGKPAIVVGHSLGGITGAHLGHGGHPLVKALFLEDPPLFLGEQGAFETTLYPTLFTMMRKAVAELQDSGAFAGDYLTFARNTPSPMGGIAADHTTERHLVSRAQQLAKVDPGVLDAAIDGTLFDGLQPAKPIACPVTLLAANPAYGAAFLDGDAERLTRGTPHAEVVAFPECGHGVRSSKVSEARFLDLLDRFATQNG